MPLTVKHSKVSAVADGPDTNLVRPSDWNADHQITGLDSITDPVAVSVNSTSPAMKITQTGTGNALVVEDVASDSTPFVVDQNGNVAIRSSTNLTGASLTVGGDTQATIDVFRPTADAGGPGLRFVKNRNASIYAHTIVNNGDALGAVQFFGSDGAANIQGAAVTAQVDGAPGTNDMPGRLIFSTTADGASTPTERMRIDSGGRVGIGSAPYAGVNVITTQPITGNAVSSAFTATGTVQSDVTNRSDTFISYVGTQAATFTLGNLRHFGAYQATIGAGSTVTNQHGFFADAGLVGATNNYGFFGNIPAGTGRYNFYAAGTADNYFAGNVGIGNLAEAGVVLSVRGAQRNHRHSANDAAPIYHANVKARGTSGTPLTVNNGDGIVSYQAYAYDGSGERQSAAIVMQVDGVPATSTVPGRIVFSTAPAGTSQVPLERMRIDSAGNVGVGAASGSYKFEVYRLSGDASHQVAAFKQQSTAHNTDVNWYNANSTTSNTLITKRTDGDLWLYQSGANGVVTYTNGVARLQVDSSGNVLVKSAAGLGYGTGAGGTVTQVTSKSTAVTLNKPCGQITMHNAPLAVDTVVGFILNNSLISSTDIPVVTLSGGNSGIGSYNVWVDNISVGACAVWLKNVGVASQAEAVTLNFAIIKGATA